MIIPRKTIRQLAVSVLLFAVTLVYLWLSPLFPSGYSDQRSATEHHAADHPREMTAVR